MLARGHNSCALGGDRGHFPAPPGDHGQWTGAGRQPQKYATNRRRGMVGKGTSDPTGRSKTRGSPPTAGLYTNMRRDCRKQLGQIKRRVQPGIACLTARGSTRFADVLLVANTVILKQARYGLKFTTISGAGITSLMGKSRKIALHAAHVASTGPRDLTDAPRDLRGVMSSASLTGTPQTSQTKRRSSIIC